MKTKKARESSAKTLRRIGNAKYLYLMLLIPVLYVVIFNYIPIGGIAMAFQRYTPRSGMFGSEWVGLYNFARFFESPVFLDVIRNTLSVSLYSLIASFPFPILQAVMVNHCLLPRFKKEVQVITFAPYFLSAVLLVGLLNQVLSVRSGIFNMAREAMGFARIDFMGVPSWFNDIYVWTGIWQTTGYSAIIYISAGPAQHSVCGLYAGGNRIHHWRQQYPKPAEPAGTTSLCNLNCWYASYDARVSVCPEILYTLTLSGTSA